MVTVCGGATANVDLYTIPCSKHVYTVHLWYYWFMMLTKLAQWNGWCKQFIYIYIHFMIRAQMIRNLHHFQKTCHMAASPDLCNALKCMISPPGWCSPKWFSRYLTGSINAEQPERHQVFEEKNGTHESGSCWSMGMEEIQRFGMFWCCFHTQRLHSVEYLPWI